MAKAAKRGLNIRPANITPSVCKVRGTGTNGIGNGGIIANTITKAVNSAARTNCCVERFKRGDLLVEFKVHPKKN